MASGSNSRGLVLLLITSCFFITGILFDYMPMIIDDHIKRTIELATNDEILAYWTKPPVDVNSYYWLYEVVNAESRLEKRIIGLSANKFRITYNSTRLMRLNESYSGELLDQPVTLANPFYASILEGVRMNAGELDGQSRAVAYGTINRLTERYNESILDRNTTARQALLGRAMPMVGKLAKMAQTMGMDGRMPELATSGKYGYASLTNNTLNGPFEIYTGYQETARSLGELISYKGKRRLNYYDGKCNRMQASAGELRPMPIDTEKRLEMFQPSFCRIIHLEPTGQHKLREGLAVSYALVADDFASAANNPDNRCYCVNSSGPTSSALENNRLDDNHCSLDGVIDLGPCSYGAPLLLAPSSVQLDSRIINSLGSEFDPEWLHGEVNEIDLADDKSQVVILKRVGVPIRADITVTLFLRLVRDASFKETANVPDVSYLPLITIRETVTIPPKLAQIIINLESFISLTYHIKVVMYLSAVVLLFWLSGHYYCITTDASSGGRLSQANEQGPGGPNGGAGLVSPQTGLPSRRATLSAVLGGGGIVNGNGSGGPGNGSAGGANGLQRLQIEEPSGGGGGMGNQQAAGKRMSGQFKSNLVGSSGAASDIRRDDKLANSGAPSLASKVGPQHRGSLLLAGSPRALGTVDEVTGPQGSGPDGRGLPGDTTSSERANSADSSRSLPPSRHTSRLGSLSQTSVELEATASSQPATPSASATSGSVTNDATVATTKAAASQQQQSAGPRDLEPSDSSNNLRRLRRDQTTIVRARPGSRIFSKVDEQLEANAAARSNRVGATICADPGSSRANNRQGTLDGGDRDDIVNELTTTTTTTTTTANQLGNEQRMANGDQATASGQALAGEAGLAQGGGRRRKRKNWFMNVYSNLVQMLNGLRSTINDAGQLEVNDNDYRDKQLEMLAGKIDNWYNSNDDGGGSGGGGGPARPARPASVDAAGADPTAGLGADAGQPDARLMVSPATVAPGSSSSGDGPVDTAQRGAPPPASSTTRTATTNTQTQTQASDGQEPGDRQTTGAGDWSEPRSGDQTIANRTGSSSARAADGDATPAGVLPAQKEAPSSGPISGSGLATATAALSSSTSPSSPGNGVKESRLDSLKRQQQLPVGAPPGAQNQAGREPRAKNSASLRSAPPPPKPPQAPSEPNAAASATTEQSETNSTERNGLNSRSMRVESSHAIDGGGGEAATGAAAGGHGGQTAEDPAARVGPAVCAGTSGAPSADQGEQKQRQQQHQSSELANGAAATNATNATDECSSESVALRTFELGPNGSAGEEETETEPETEAEGELANELDKATTLDRIEAALNGTDDEAAAAVADRQDQQQDEQQQQQQPLAPNEPSMGARNQVDSAKQSSGRQAAASDETIEQTTTTMINSSTSLDSVIDLKTSTAAVSPDGPQLVNQSTTANGPLGPSNLAAKTIDGRSLGPGPPADKLLESNGLAARGPTPARGPAQVPLPPSQSPPTTGQPIKNNNNAAGAAAASMITRPEGAREKLVVVDDDDEIDQQQQRQQEPLDEMRTKNSSKSLVSNSLLQSSGREQRQRLLSANDADHDLDDRQHQGDQPKLRTLTNEDVPTETGDDDGIKNATRPAASSGHEAQAQSASSTLKPATTNDDESDQNQRNEPAGTITSINGKAEIGQSQNRRQGSSETTTARAPSTANNGNRRQAIDDEIQSATNSPSSASNEILGPSACTNGGHIGLGASSDPLASPTNIATNSAPQLAPNNMANKRKQQQQQLQARVGANNGSVTSWQQQQQLHNSKMGPPLGHTEQRRLAKLANGKPLAFNNLLGPDDSNGNNILNGKIISHYQGQVARAAGGSAHRQPVVSRAQVANHKHTTVGNHHHHQQQRPVQPAGA